MADFTVLAEGFAMIRGCNDQRRLPRVAQRIDQPARLSIRFRNLLVVANRDGTPGLVGIGRVAVWRVRLEQVNPGEEPLLAMMLEPVGRFVDDDASRPFVRGAAVLPTRHAIAVGLEASVQSEPPIERKRGDERGCRDAVLRERVGDGRRA